MDESKRYLWHLYVFLVLTILTLLGGVSMIPEIYWRVGATHIVRCGEFCT